jgi:hypothetical protein
VLIVTLKEPRTLKELEDIIALRSEIVQLNKSMEKHYKAGDFVGDYGYAPNSGRPFPIYGIAVKDEPALARKKERLKKKIAELQVQIEAAEKFIDEIKCPTVRVLTRERILNGATWKEAAKAVYNKMTANAALQCVKRYFEGGA